MDVSCIVYIIFTIFTSGGNFLLSPCVRWARLFIVVLARRPFPLVSGVQLTGLFKDPTISVGMIGRLVRGAMNLARTIEYSIQTRWTILVSFELLLPLTRLRATESGVNRRVFGILVVASTLVLVASWLAIAIPGFGGSRVAGAIASTS